jgi:hypothetical protein
MRQAVAMLPEITVMSGNRTKPILHERRDVLCGVVFVPAAIIVAARIEVHRFDRGFWIALTIALVAWILAYRKWAPLVGLFGFTAFRFGLAFLSSHDPRYLAVGLTAAALTISILWARRNSE